MRNRLRNKIEQDTGVHIPDDSIFIRKNLSRNNKSAGCFKWFFVIRNDGHSIGSTEGIRELMKSPKILMSRSSHGDFELSSS